MSANGLAVKYTVDDTEVNLTQAGICRFLLGGRSDIPEPEIVRFMMTCKARKLNPFTNDVYLIPYNTRDGVKCNIIAGKETFTKRAQRSPRYRGLEAGITIITRDGRLIRREGSMPLDGEVLVGGWAKAFIEGWDKPSFDEVSFKEYNTGRNLWLTKPGTMIRKCAIQHALREAFPDELGGLYGQEEMGIDSVPQNVIPIEAINQQQEINQQQSIEPDYEEGEF